jgi:muconolactone delta-isomerase
LKQKLLQANEKAQADLGYRGEPKTIWKPNDFDSPAIAKLKKDVRARHEHVNKRLKQFGALNRVFRHELCKHKAVFEACAVLTQMAIADGEPLCQVQYGHLPLHLWRNRRSYVTNFPGNY